MDTTDLMSTRGTLGSKFFYVCTSRTNQLQRTNLLTCEQSCHQLHLYRFREECRWSELPGGSLLITGGIEGYLSTVSEVVRIDTLREWAVSFLPPMHTARCDHAAVYHSQYLYVLGGYNLSECERYVCTEKRWEVLSDLPVGGGAMSAVVMDNSLYAHGGSTYPSDLDTVQKFSLDSLTWELMQLKLPQACNSIPCFKTDTQVYLMIEETLYSFTPLQVKPVKTLPIYIECITSYYSRGTLYYEDDGTIASLYIGELD
jgi:hypothetical protein